MKESGQKSRFFEKLGQSVGKKLHDAIVWAAEILIVCLLAVMLVLLFGQQVTQKGDAMEPVVSDGSKVLVNRFIYRITEPKRGDLIVYRNSDDVQDSYSIRRVAAVPGETIQIVDGKVYIDGVLWETEIYASGIEAPGLAEEPLTLGEGEYFVLGDVPGVSADSRMAQIGNIKKEKIYGKAWFVAGEGQFGFL